MPGGELALDTNAASAIMEGDGDLRPILLQYSGQIMPVIVLGELRYGAINSTRADENNRRIEDLRARCRLVNVDEETATRFAQVRHNLKRKGRPIPENDLWIAASALRNGLPLLTRDAHFRDVDGLEVVTW